MKYVLSIDQGTSSTRSIIFDEMGNIIGQAHKEHKQYYPQEAWVEHDPTEIKNAVLETMKTSLEKTHLGFGDISSIGITNQRETVVAWNKETGQPYGHAIVWQCRRTAPMVSELRKEGLENVFHQKTGLVLDAYFSGTKMKWLLDHNDRISEGATTGKLAFGTIDSWIIASLTGNHRTDASNASRTLLYDIAKNEWSDELCEILSIPQSSLPEVMPNASTPFGFFETGPHQIPIRGVLGDQQSALFGQTAFEEGQSKTTYGTGNFTLINTGNKMRTSSHGLLTTVGWQVNDQTWYALEGSVFISGAALQWLRDELDLFEDYSQIDELAKTVENSGQVFFVPAFVGLGAPYWDSTARGTILGITGGTSKAHLVRATLNAIALQTNDLLETMEIESGLKFEEMRADGGITNSAVLMQLQADVSQLRIEIPTITETTAMGAALIAGLYEIWDDFEELKTINPTKAMYTPKLSEREIKPLLEQWKIAVKRAQNWV